MANFYTNENFPLPAVIHLRKLGYDVLTTFEAGKANQSLSDEEVLAFAHRHGRILVTLNRKHFIHLHEKYPHHSGIIVCTVDPNFSGLAERISSAVEQSKPIEGKLLRINRISLSGGVSA